MKNAFVVASAVLVSILAVSQSGVINEPLEDVAEYSLIDPIIKAILESMRPKLANLTIDPINETVRSPGLNASIAVNDVLVQDADRFVIRNLKSTLVPLKLTNLTLTWDRITARASYNINANVSFSPNSSALNIFGKGKANATLYGVFFTIGANVEMKNNAIQIKPKGLFGFDLYVRKANVTLSSLMGSPELGNGVGVFISNAIPDLVNALKKPVFNALQDDIIRIVNQILKNNGTKSFSDEEPALPDFSSESLDLSEELGQALDFDLGELGFDAEF